MLVQPLKSACKIKDQCKLETMQNRNKDQNNQNNYWKVNVYSILIYEIPSIYHGYIQMTDIDWFTSLSASVQMCRYLLVPACIGVSVWCSPLCTPSLYQSVNIILLSGQFPSLTPRSLDTGIVSPQQQHFRHTGTLPTTHHIYSTHNLSWVFTSMLNVTSNLSNFVSPSLGKIETNSKYIQRKCTFPVREKV